MNDWTTECAVDSMNGYACPPARAAIPAVLRDWLLAIRSMSLPIRTRVSHEDRENSIMCVNRIFLHLCLFCVTVFLMNAAAAQDRYFTQFYAVPVEINPALTGSLPGSYRVAMIYRDQWRGIVQQPFQSYGVFGDLRMSLGRRTSDFAGVGIQVTADRVGLFDFNTNQINLSGAFHKHLDGFAEQFLSAGVYLGVVQRNTNFEHLIFDDQFNGLNGYTFPTREELPENNFAHADLGIGINYSAVPSRNLALAGGLAVAHLTGSSVSLFRRTETLFDYDDFRLYRKITGYASADITMNEQVRLLPRAAVLIQGPSLLLHSGMHVRFGINEYNNNALHIGGGMRMTKDLGNIAPSAVMLLTGIELGNFFIGLSYDYNVSSLSQGRIGRGVYEISISFVGEYENISTFCPTF